MNDSSVLLLTETCTAWNPSGDGIFRGLLERLIHKNKANGSL